MASSTSSSNDVNPLGFHRGAIDQTTITTQPPFKVMKHVNTILRDMGVQIQEESAFHYRCIRAGRRVVADTVSVDHEGEVLAVSEEPDIAVLYGGATEDIGDEVRFSVELTRLGGLNDTYSLDIRRLKGNLRSYKFIYDTIRNRAQVNR